MGEADTSRQLATNMRGFEAFGVVFWREGGISGTSQKTGARSYSEAMETKINRPQVSPIVAGTSDPAYHLHL